MFCLDISGGFFLFFRPLTKTMHSATVLTSQQSGNENADGLNLKAGYSLRDFNNLSKRAAVYDMDLSAESATWSTGCIMKTH